MKLSEKTLELNICAQVHTAVSPRVSLFWFGLTQRQEARMGFDACTKLGGRLLIFQFKASNHRLQNGKRKFQLNHDQLHALHSLAGHPRRSVFYAFPLVGNTHELLGCRDLLDETWLLDVSGLHTLSEPKKKDGTPRRNRRHNAYVIPHWVTICSEPFKDRLISMREFVTDSFRGTDGVPYWEPDSFDRFWEMKKYFSRGARGLIVYQGAERPSDRNFTV